MSESIGKTLKKKQSTSADALSLFRKGDLVKLTAMGWQTLQDFVRGDYDADPALDEASIGDTGLITHAYDGIRKYKVHWFKTNCVTLMCYGEICRISNERSG